MTCKELAEKLMQHPDKPVYVSIDADNGEYLFPLDCVVSETTVTNERNGTKANCVLIDIGNLPCCEDDEDDAEDTGTEEEHIATTAMSRSEMIDFIRSHPHVKITHPLFEAHEYLFSGENGTVYDEDCRPFEDWYGNYNSLRTRTGGQWETGWFIKS